MSLLVRSSSSPFQFCASPCRTQTFAKPIACSSMAQLKQVTPYGQALDTAPTLQKVPHTRHSPRMSCRTPSSAPWTSFSNTSGIPNVVPRLTTRKDRTDVAPAFRILPSLSDKDLVASLDVIRGWSLTNRRRCRRVDRMSSRDSCSSPEAHVNQRPWGVRSRVARPCTPACADWVYWAGMIRIVRGEERCG